MSKYVFVTGGVVSGLGKGVVTASLGCLLQARGVAVTLQKIDPYLNVDAGTMNPYEHGEVFVTRDGLETDLDVGHYERFLGQDLGAANYLTTGQVYWNVIGRERHGDYLGHTVQVIPHITDEIKRLIRGVLAATGAEVVVVEVGGTVGDIEGLPYLEAIRQLRDELPRQDVSVVHLSYVPVLSTTGELKTKPTQHSVKELRAVGIQPDFVVARCPVPLPEGLRAKIALFCDVAPDHVIEGRDLVSIYEVPLALREEGFDVKLLARLGLPVHSGDLAAWESFVNRLRCPSRAVRIGIVGKYVELRDAYLSIVEALHHAGAALETKVDIAWVPAARVEEEGEGALDGLAGILVPGGFGERGIEGKVLAAGYARRAGVPFFGICLGMQCAVIAFAREVLGWPRANSTEFDPGTPHPVIDLLPEQGKVTAKGGTMRLGEYPAVLAPGSLVHRLYGQDEIAERHRHRYEFNPKYLSAFAAVGLRPSALSPDGRLVEAMEAVDHPWYVGVQYHPEFRSRPLRPHPLFLGFVQACLASSSR
ncbi:CTP synthase [Candidatus Bipolaricaulota bacterium]|nr:CTP synthase [Candidatus Bipolaricaulota bacterium]